MKAYITIASDWNYKKIKEFNSLEDAFATLRREFKKDAFVIDFDSNKADVNITIYDTWIE